ncbi:MAG: amidohydrolase family protein, partial [Planctomycetota bacterium]|nr:amidohydrolase family protein [Planctomycetota bacterium]
DLAKYLEQVQLSRAPFLIVHGNYLRPRSVPAGAFVVYCPIAHHFFGHPEHPVLELLQEGVRVALGSDSAASGDTIDVLSETKFLGRARPDLDARAVFRMATEWGARALDLDTGVLHVGRPADLAAFTPDLGPSVLGHTDAKCIFACVGGRVAYQDPDHDGSAATD